MANIPDLLAAIRRTPKDVSFSELCKICEHYFGKPRQPGTSLRIYKTPWIGDPRVNIHSFKGKAKPYQVRQVLTAIGRIEASNETE